MEGLSNVKMVACGQQHTLALTASNHIYTWGDNKYGQLGLDPISYPTVTTPKCLDLTNLHIKSITTVYTGWTHSAILAGNSNILYYIFCKLFCV